MTCHIPVDGESTGETIVLVGHPNVGKSTLFEALTGRRVITANYPGTTVEVARAAGRRVDGAVVDSPGLLTFPSRTDDEQATARILLEETIKSMVQVGDAKSLRRTLLLTVQLAEFGAPMVLALNMADEADQRGVELDLPALGRSLGVPVLATTANRGVGISELESEVASARPPSVRVVYDPAVEHAVQAAQPLLPSASVSSRALALLWLTRDPAADQWVRDRAVAQRIADLEALREPVLPSLIQEARIQAADSLAEAATTAAGLTGSDFRTLLGRATSHPVAGLPFVAAALLALYGFVGGVRCRHSRELVGGPPVRRAYQSKCHEVGRIAGSGSVGQRRAGW